MIGINPCVKEWISEKEMMDFAEENKKYGITHYMLQRMHQGHNSLTAIEKLKKLPDGETIVQNALTRNKPPFTGQLYVQGLVMRLRNESKVNAMWFGLPLPIDFFQDFYKALGKHFPATYEFYNYCIEKSLDQVTFADYIGAITKGNESFFDTDFNGIPAYILRVKRELWKGNAKTQSIRTIRELLNIYWNEPKLGNSPQCNRVLYRKLPELDGDGNIILERKKIIGIPEKNGSFANCNN